MTEEEYDDTKKALYEYDKSEFALSRYYMLKNEDIKIETDRAKFKTPNGFNFGKTRD